VHVHARLLDAASDAKHLPEAVGQVWIENVVELVGEDLNSATANPDFVLLVQDWLFLQDITSCIL